MRIFKIPFRPICDLYSKVGYIIDSSGLVSPRTTAQANGYCTYINVNMYYACINFEVYPGKQKII